MAGDCGIPGIGGLGGNEESESEAVHPTPTNRNTVTIKIAIKVTRDLCIASKRGQRDCDAR